MTNGTNGHGGSSPDPVQILRQEREALIRNLRNGTAPDFLGQHSRLVDEYFRESYVKGHLTSGSLAPKGPGIDPEQGHYAIIALGGYGRQEQCLHSDIDVLFLYDKAVPQSAEDLIAQMVYPLWDMGFEVGYAVRMVAECIELAAQRFDILVPLLDARFVCGFSPIFSRLNELLQQEVIQPQARGIITDLVQGSQERHRHFGDATYLLEPNLKEGTGGLRDYHAMLWMGRIKVDLRTPRDLEYHGCLSNAEFEELSASLSYVWQVRNHLHLLCGRKSDQLNLEYQIKLAEILDYTPENGQAPVERFLSDLHGRMNFIKQQHQMVLYERGFTRRKTSGAAVPKKTKVRGILIVHEKLTFSSPKAIVRSPELLIRIFEESSRQRKPLNAEARRLIREFTDLIDEEFQCDPDILRTFERILTAPARKFNVLEQMLTTGFLPHYIPEFSAVFNRIQFNTYHLFPVDKHLLQTVFYLKQFGAGPAKNDDTSIDPLCTELYRELPRKRPLFWAALLHDIGKGTPGENHSRKGADMAQAILTHKGLKPAVVECVCFLIQEHLLMIHVATRRDLNDEETAVFCARRIQSVERLKMLYLLSVADAMATGPKAWNDWTAALLRDLFFKTLNVLRHGELTSRKAREIEEAKRDALAEALKSDLNVADVDSVMRIFSHRYLLYTPIPDILAHKRLHDKLTQARFVWDVAVNPETQTRLVTICAQDRPGLFSKIAGVFTLNNLDILNAQIYTWRNRSALDIFDVAPPPDQLLEDRGWQRTASQLDAALAGDLDLRADLAKKIKSRSIYTGTETHPAIRQPPKVKIDVQTSGFFTIIEVYCHNFPGLLFCITDILFQKELDIWVAKIATQLDQVVDVFYVRDLNGEKITDPEKIAEIEAAILETLEGLLDSDH